MFVFMVGGVSGWEILEKKKKTTSKWEGLVDSLTAIDWVTIYISREKTHVVVLQQLHKFK